ncbi:transposase [bacterium]|nr:transposase [bacterium]
MNLDKGRTKAMNDPSAWYNQFFEHVTDRIMESGFSVLYNEQFGRSNAPIRILLAMMALKEGFGWSDEQLYEQVNFNLLVMKALGFAKLSDKAPVASTYYLFKQLVYQYQVQHGRDLVKEAFQQLTDAQSSIFGVSGDKVRMDSKLIGSNIAKCSRLQLVISCLQVFWESLSKEQQKQLGKQHRYQIDLLCQKKPHQIVYTMTNEDKAQKLLELGALLSLLQQLYNDSDSPQYFLIERLLAEQYVIKHKKVTLKPVKEIATDSIQSPHDVDAAYRKKKDQTVRGYSVNITETCNRLGLNLVTDVQLEKANIADKDFTQPALDDTAKVVRKVKEAYMDGAYQARDNREYAESKDIKFYFTGIQGPEGNFEFIPSENGLSVFDKQTGQTIEATEYKPGQYKIQLPTGKWRYIKADEIESFKRRKAIEELPASIKNRRNNVEATIFQLSYHTRKDKTRYRGQYRNKMWAICRCMWINLIRIRNYMKDLLKQTLIATQ